MARGGVRMSAGWEEMLYAGTDRFLGGVLGPAIRDDAYRFCPKLTGALADSIEDHMSDHTLVVSATGSDERDYAAYVECGHRIAHGPRMSEVGPARVAPQPFLRPALYAVRTP